MATRITMRRFCRVMLMSPWEAARGRRLEERLDLLLEDRLGHRPDEALDDLPVAVHQDLGGEADEWTVALLHRRVAQERRVGDAVLLDERLHHVGALVVHGDADHR